MRHKSLYGDGRRAYDGDNAPRDQLGVWELDTLNQAPGDPFLAISSEEMFKCFLKGPPIAERVAMQARVDHLRVDLLVSGACEDLFISEVELFPAVPLSARGREVVAARWRYGYGVDELDVL